MFGIGLLRGKASIKAWVIIFTTTAFPANEHTHTVVPVLRALVLGVWENTDASSATLANDAANSSLEFGRCPAYPTILPVSCGDASRLTSG